MVELNKIYCCDVLEGLRQLEDESVDVIITSPPYNKMGLNGFSNRKKRGTWYETIDYNGDIDVDNMPEEEYQKWQIEVLNECYRVLKKNGSMFYNHKNRIRSGAGEIISPYEWLYKTNFKIRQEIIWDRNGTNNVKRCRYLPTTEKIFWLTKDKTVNFDRDLDTKYKMEVWRLQFGRYTPHPAPFPVELPDNILDCIKSDERLIVLDPFMGSGTVAISAIKHNYDYIGFEKFETYIEMANKRIKDETETMELFPAE